MFFTDPITSLLSIILCLCLIWILYGWNRTVHMNSPPGPKPLPVIGNLHIIDKKEPYKTFLELSKKYGSIYSFHMGAQKWVILCGYETIKDALVNHADEFSGRGKIPIFHEGSKGYGVVYSNGENWKVMRRFALSTLRDFGMGKKTLEDKINEECESLLQRLVTFKGKPFENTMILNGAVANIIVSILFGYRFDYNDPKFLRLMSLINENIKLLGSPSIMLYNTFPSVLRWFPGNHKKIHGNSEEFRTFIKGIFLKYKDQLDINDQRNLIDAFLVKQQEEKPTTGVYFHDNNLLSLVSNLFGAGMETTSTTLRWSCLIMMKYPDIQKTVQNEIEKVIGSAQPQMEHRKKMPFTDAVIHEIQRFANIVPLNIPHETTQDVTFKGYCLPKGTCIIPVLASVLKDKAYFKKPDEFYPQHFLDSDGNFVKNDAFMPFSAVSEILTPSYAPANILTPINNLAFSNLIYQNQGRSLSCLAEDMVFTFPVAILLPVVLFICLISLLYGWNRKSYHNFPPGPKPLPFIGNLHIIDKRESYKTFMKLSEKYGPVFSIQLGIQKMVMLCGYDAVKDALVNYGDALSGRGNVPIFHETSKGHGIVFGNGESWKVMRRFTLSTLRDFGMGKKSLEEKINEESDCLVQRFNSYKGKPFENTKIMNAAVSNIIVAILLDRRFDYEDPLLLRLMKLTNENIELLGSPMIMLYNTFPSVISWLPGVHKTIKKNTEEYNNFIEETFAKNKDELDVNDQRNLVDAFLVKQQEENSSVGQYFHNENLKHLVSDLFGAGMETTSTTLRWAFIIMMKYPKMQKKVQSEIDKVIGSAEPSMEHRKNMPYTDAVIHEVQRFGNIVPTSIPRETTQDITLKGYHIPKGTQVFPVLASVLQDKAYFKKPDEFYPEHFLDSAGRFVKNDAFLPFSAGRRICAGENLARMELFLFFTRLLQKFTFQPPPGSPDIDLCPSNGLTRGPKTYQMCALPRT